MTNVGADRVSRTATIVAHVLFGALLALNVYRALHHALWSDEIRPFLIAADSATFVDVFRELRYEGHPGLWYAILWVLTRVTADPVAMQIVHATIATGVWLLIYRCSPFGTREKLLLVVGYFLFWEYFVLCRSYALMALLGFAFIAVRARGSRSRLVPWLLLGLLANTTVYGAIWSLAMGVFFGAERARADGRSALLGAGAYLALLALAAWSMAPAPDALHVRMYSIGMGRFVSLYTFPAEALAPFPATWLKGVWASLTRPGATEFPRFWNPLPVDALAGVLALGDHPARVVAILVGALAACTLVLRDRRAVAEFALGYVGVLLFTYIWHFRGYARHHGIVFLMLIGAAWMTRVRDPRVAARWLWWAVLGVNALAGLTTMASELRPFSEGRDVAAWLRERDLADAFLVGSPDVAVVTVAGYLRRPIYYLETESRRRFVRGDTHRQTDLDAAEIGRRLVRAVAGHDDAILILDHELAPETETATASRFSFTLLRAFTRAVVPRERYFVYRVTTRDPLP